MEDIRMISKEIWKQKREESCTSKMSQEKRREKVIKREIHCILCDNFWLEILKPIINSYGYELNDEVSLRVAILTHDILKVDCEENNNSHRREGASYIKAINFKENNIDRDLVAKIIRKHGGKKIEKLTQKEKRYVLWMRICDKFSKISTKKSEKCKKILEEFYKESNNLILDVFDRDLYKIICFFNKLYENSREFEK